MKKFLAVILAVSLLLACLFVTPVTAADSNVWDGESKSEPKDTNSDGIKEIGTAAEFAWLGANGGNGKYILTNDIYLNDLVVSWSGNEAVLTKRDGTPITDLSSLNDWTAAASFSGVLDGNGHTVNGLFNDTVIAVGSNSRHAMFLTGTGATVKNLRVSNTYFEGATYQGTLFAYNNSKGVCTISNCYIDNVYLKSNPDEISNSCYPSSGAVIGYINGADLVASYVAVNNVKLIADRTGVFSGDAWASGNVTVSNSYNSTEYRTFGGKDHASNYKGTMSSEALYSATQNSGTVVPAVILVSAVDMVGDKAATSMLGIGNNFYTTESYPMQEIFLKNKDSAINKPLGVAPEFSGITIADSSETYRTSSRLTATPLTWEAVIKVDTTAPARPGVIIGNYKSASVNSFNFEIRDGGHPSVYYQLGGSGKSNTFSGIDLRTGEKTHVAVTVDPTAKTATCYINGVAKQTLSGVEFTSTEVSNVACIGGDLRDGNAQSLKNSELYSVAVYSDTRTAEEIAADAKNINMADETLLAGYDFTLNDSAKLTDFSKNNKHLVYSGSKTFESGMTFSEDETYRTKTIPDALPMTVEADIFVDPAAPSTRLFTIFGNYFKYSENTPNAECFNFEIRENGAPSIYLQKKGNVRNRLDFKSIDLRKEGRVHLAITIDYTNNTLNCYINGVLRETLVSETALYVPEMTNVFGVGRDIRSETGDYHLIYSELYSVAAYSDLRTEAEINNDARSADLSDVNMLFRYDLSSNSANCLDDLSAQSNDLVYIDNLPVPTDGVTIGTENLYKAEDVLSEFPETIEATIYFPRSFDGAERGGVITGNYGTNDNKKVVNLEIYTDGQPRLYICDQNSRSKSLVFTKVDVRVGKWLHLAVTFDKQTGTATCYVNGEAKQTLSVSDFVVSAPVEPLYVGTDYRGAGNTAFQGKLKNVAYYADVRTADEIKADMTAVDLGDANLLAAYDLTSAHHKDVTDLSANGIDLKNQGTFYLDTAPELDDFAYSFAVVGDTQIITQRYPSKLANIYDYIVNNIDTYNIKHVFGMGDITNGNTATEWNTAMEQINKMNGKVSYSLVRGNHDGKTEYDANLGGDNLYAAQYDGAFEEGSALNVYQYLTVGKIDYLIFSLDYGYSDEVIAWASEIIEAHPNHNVIITTHAYFYRDGTTLDQSDVCPPATTGGSNNGDHMWDKFISKHDNIVLALCGHDPCAKTVTVQTAGENGNIVTSMLVDPQGLDADASVGPTGMVTMLHFSEDGKTVQVRTYSTIKEQYYGNQNQYTIEMAVVEPTMGDANDDGAVNVFDLVVVTKAVNGEDVTFNRNTADVNGDGKIDSLDLAEIRKIIIA